MLGLRIATRSARSVRTMATKASAVKALAADQKAVASAIDALGPNASFYQVKEVTGSGKHAETIAKVKDAGLSWTWQMLESKPEKPAVTVAVSGKSDVAAETLYRIAAGEMLGTDQAVELKVVGGDAAVIADVEACGFPLLKGISSATAVSGAKYAILLDGDFAALGKGADKGALVGVLGNTNALAASKSCAGSVTAITRGAQMQAELELAKAAGVGPTDVSGVISWGTGIADISHATVGGKWALKDGASGVMDVSPSVGVAADGVVFHMRDWAFGSGDKWVSMGVPAVGDYGMGEGFFYSVPVICGPPGHFRRVGGVSLSPEVAAAMESSRTALVAEAAKM